MSWREQLRPGSFRGAAFRIQESEGEGGRRGELHEFPERDQPYYEDLGRAARRWTVGAIVIGADYMADRDALIAACEAGGAGTLVHPYLGTLSAVVTSFRYRETTAEGGMASFSIEFAEPGAIVVTEVSQDTAGAATLAADEVEAAAPAQFASDFSVASMPAFVEEAGADLVRRVVSFAADLGLSLGGGGLALRAFDTGLSLLPSGAIALVRAPLALGLSIIGMVTALARLGSSPGARVAAMRRLLNDGVAFPPVIGETPVRMRQRANQVAFAQLVVTAAAAEAVRAATEIRFTSYDDAVRLRDGLHDDLDRVAIAAADAGDDTSTDTLDRLRLVMVRDVTARGGSLDRLYRYVPAATEPALVISQRLYGAPSLVIDRAAELVERNGVTHPGFVPGGRSIEVRTNG